MTAPRALTQNAASGKQVRRAGKHEKRDARVLAIDTVVVMGTPEGRRFMWWLLGECRTFASVMADGRPEYNAGKQDVGHMLQAHIITTDPDAYLLMQREAIDATKQEQAAAPVEEAGMLSEKPETTEDDDG